MRSVTNNRWRQGRDTAADAARRAKYDSPEHRAARAYYGLQVAKRQAVCWRCGNLLLPGRWHVGHDDHDTSAIRGPECDTCNRKAGARKGALIANARRKARREAAAFVRPRR